MCMFVIFFVSSSHTIKQSFFFCVFVLNHKGNNSSEGDGQVSSAGELSSSASGDWEGGKLVGGLFGFSLGGHGKTGGLRLNSVRDVVVAISGLGVSRLLGDGLCLDGLSVHGLLRLGLSLSRLGVGRLVRGRLSLDRLGRNSLLSHLRNGLSLDGSLVSLGGGVESSSLVVRRGRVHNSGGLLNLGGRDPRRDVSSSSSVDSGGDLADRAVGNLRGTLGDGVGLGSVEG